MAENHQQAQTAFLVTLSSGSAPHGRPMATAQVDDGLETIYFATERNSPKVSEIKTNNRVFLGYTAGNDWASITGLAHIINDREKIQELWTDAWKNWFSGPDDPNLTLIAVSPEIGEYWDAPGRAVVVAKLAYTAVTGKKTELGSHAKVAL
ncbi:MAG: pyridoxamine 5'-phosphate oxidase family protein [Tepidisphaeraceae bacterium]